MNYFIRFSDTIESDIARNTSVLTNHNNEIVEGLCVFVGSETIEDSHKKAKMIGFRVCEKGEKYSILRGKITFGKKGTIGTVITDCEIIETGIIENVSE